jgi:hypothetical protein
MGKWVHRLSNRDLDNLTADCAKCGPVKVRKNGNSMICPGSQKDYDNGKRKGVINPYFGITHGEVQELKQDQTCFICGTTENLHLDHDHNTGVIRGVLCMSHNTALGKFQDNIDYLERAIIYLKR